MDIKKRIEEICNSSEIDGSETKVTVSKEDFLWIIKIIGYYQDENRGLHLDNASRLRELNLLHKEINRLNDEITEKEEHKKDYTQILSELNKSIKTMLKIKFICERAKKTHIETKDIDDILELLKTEF